MPEPSLELLQQMVQRVHVDRSEQDTEIQDQIDRLTSRLERLEEHAG